MSYNLACTPVEWWSYGIQGPRARREPYLKQHESLQCRQSHALAMEAAVCPIRSAHLHISNHNEILDPTLPTLNPIDPKSTRKTLALNTKPEFHNLIALNARKLSSPSCLLLGFLRRLGLDKTGKRV